MPTFDALPPKPPKKQKEKTKKTPKTPPRQARTGLDRAATEQKEIRWGGLRNSWHGEKTLTKKRKDALLNRYGRWPSPKRTVIRTLYDKREVTLGLPRKERN